MCLYGSSQRTLQLNTNGLNMIVATHLILLGIRYFNFMLRISQNKYYVFVLFVRPIMSFVGKYFNSKLMFCFFDYENQLNLLI